MKELVWEKWIGELNRINEKQLSAEQIQKNLPPHFSNILHQLNKSGNGKDKETYKEIIDMYLEFRACFDEDYSNKEQLIEEVVGACNKYLDLFTRIKFSHRADFASSVIPEMLYLLFYKMITYYDTDLLVTSQGDINIECMFDLQDNEGKIIFKKKRVDVAIVKENKLAFNKEEYEFYIPIVAIEVKTNLDKNMISGIENSVHSLKKTFPNCLYYTISELSDFKLELNYASSDIDEMYILREQKRSFVRKYPSLREEIDVELVKEIIENIEQKILSSRNIVESIDNRMSNGKLIGRG